MGNKAIEAAQNQPSTTDVNLSNEEPDGIQINNMSRVYSRLLRKGLRQDQITLQMEALFGERYYQPADSPAPGRQLADIWNEYLSTVEA